MPVNSTCFFVTHGEAGPGFSIANHRPRTRRKGCTATTHSRYATLSYEGPSRPSALLIRSLKLSYSQLIRECKTSGERLIQYNGDRVRAAVQEVTALDADLKKTLNDQGDVLRYERDTSRGRGLVCKLYMDRQAMLRNKRCLLAYHNHRLGKLKDLFWDTSCGGEPQQHEKSLMSQDEIAFYRDYAKLVLDYADDVQDDGVDFGLTTQTLQPPKEIFICVRVVKPVGKIVTPDGGSLDLPLGVQTWVERSLVEQLITQGMLVQVNRANQGQYGA